MTIHLKYSDTFKMGTVFTYCAQHVPAKMATTDKAAVTCLKCLQEIRKHEQK